MTAAARGEPDDAKHVALQAEAVALALEQKGLKRVQGGVPSFLEASSSPVARALDRARKYLASKHHDEVALRRAADWFLDNYYLIRRAARQVTQDLPPGFLRRLPRLADGPSEGLPRIDSIARVLVVTSSVEIDVTAVESFIDAYQTVSPLTIAEIWALPTMLRVSVLHGLVRCLDALGVPMDGLERAPPRRQPPDIDPARLGPGLGVERAVRALRLLAEIDWKTLFERTNRVEAILRKDPTGVYERMDFVTCDRYRKEVEELAWVTETLEEEVAESAIELARLRLGDPRCAHVGYYLIDGGRQSLEARLAYAPRGMERVRRLLTGHPTLAYLSALSLASGAFLIALGWTLARAGSAHAAIVASLLLAALPASIVSVAATQWALARILPPRVLPKLDFGKGLPSDIRALVVIPTLLGRREDVGTMLRQIELHYLSNRDSNLGFALLTDDVDAKTPVAATTLLDSVAEGVAALNMRYGAGKVGPFHLLHRAARWNEAEERFMGWERKRGKLDELNRLLRGATDTSFSLHVGDPDGLRAIRFVVTVDSDTQVPMGTARRLVGILAHPLNQAVFDDASGRVVSGYTIVQPRVEMSPSSARQTLFARIFGGDVGFDIYTHASSESYQDLFGAGIYVGKGIYDVDGFIRSVHGRVPENALASHDLFEGIHGRTALASDVALFETYPSNYLAYARRLHRWVRGDWQLVPWVFSSVPSKGDGRVPSVLTAIDRWKILDNLRRSLASPVLFAILVLGFLALPGPPLFWAFLALSVLLFPSLPAVLRDRRRRGLNLARCALAVAFLAHETVVVLDAVARVTVRMTITRKRLLEWTSAAHAEVATGAHSSRWATWREMIWSPVIATAIAVLAGSSRPSALFVATPFLVLWFVAPEIARAVGKPARSHEAPLGEPERRRLRLLARRTWHFFDVFVGPGDQWLPIDNYQEAPREQKAHRTSPTNIGMMLLSTLAAYDLGYLGPGELSLRLRSAFESIERLVHYQGHLFNWYDTKNLEPLLPRYVSTVDSGNFAGSLVALKKGCRDVASAPVLRAAAWEGLGDSLGLLEEALPTVGRGKTSALLAVIARLRRGIEGGGADAEGAYETLRTLCDETAAALDRELLTLLESGALRSDAEALQALRTSIERFHRQLHQMRQEIDLLLPWLALREEVALVEIALPVRLRLDQVPAASRRLLTDIETRAGDLRARGAMTGDLEASIARVRTALRGSEAHATTLGDGLRDLAVRAEGEVSRMDFRLLYDRERKLFRIGYNATQDVLDAHYYDLLASEARLASYLAIVKGDVPESHWAMLGRPLTEVAGSPLLLSWGGTMFEYLMPALLMRSRTGTLLAQTNTLVVEAQIAYGQAKGAPWGISESAFARLDSQQTYQYQSFGVPGLGFKRGLEDDLVVAPYASVLAVSIRPRAVLVNVERLTAMGMLGTYGLFEALDMTPDRAPDTRRFAPVRSYMAHHQGMILVAIGNALTNQRMVERFHDDRQVETGELFLNEHAPRVAPREWPEGESTETASALIDPSPRPPPPWSPDSQGRPQAFVLGNGRLSSLLTSSGGGGLQWQGLAITRYEADVVGEGDGLWIYLRDEDSGRVWRGTSDRGSTTYAMHEVKFHQRDHGISVRVDVAIAPADDVEVRLVTLHNETDATRSLSVTSAGEPVLFPPRDAATHPAFGRMFVESEHVPELDALVFHRRARGPSEQRAIVAHRFVTEGPAAAYAGFETDRGAFFGRGSDARAPKSLARSAGGASSGAGAVLDPIMSLTARVTLKPKQAVSLAFVTSVARTRAEALDLARRYGSMHAVKWTFRDAEQECARRLSLAQLEPHLLPAVQQLLSALLFSDPSFRAPSEALSSARPNKRRLWGRGISGDDPIVLVRVAQVEAPLVREVIAAQRFLRSCGVRFDLALVDEQASGYIADGAGTLRNLLAESDGGEWLEKHGGIFVLVADQVPAEERLHLEACARVVLDTREGSLASRMARPIAPRPDLPRFEPTLVAEEAAVGVRAPALVFDNGTGGFTEDGREYVISVRPGRPTPAPWCNVLANPDFGCLVSESSLCSTWSLNAGENRLTPWRNDPVFDTPAEALYLRDEETAAVWSTTPSPAGGSAETLVRHGAGYTVYHRETHGLEQELTIFVPSDAPLKVARLRLKNKLARNRRLTATYYAEWVLGSAREEQRPFVTSEMDTQNACLLARCNWGMDFGERVAFLASERAPHGFTTDRVEFLGRRGDYARPEALERWGLAGSVSPGLDPCAALQVHVELGAGEELQTHFLLGQAASREESLALVARFRDAAVVERAWTQLGVSWDQLLGAVRVKTPEPAMDLMLNRWLLYQTLSSRVFGRTAFYQSSGAFGFRDQLQDVLALFHGSPDRARAHILEAARHQFEEGDVLHWWHPPAGRGVRTRCSDDLVWLPFVTAEYVRATGDSAILAEEIPFLSGAPLRSDEHDRYAEFSSSAGTASLFDHCRRALTRALTEGAHGLPLMGDGDWNDGMNRVGAEGRGESVWLGWFLCATMDRFAGICDGQGENPEAEQWRSRAVSLRARIEASAWDGSWYLRAFHDDGSLVGSARNRECQIDSIAQTWAVLSRAPDLGPLQAHERAVLALRAAEERLVRGDDRFVLLLAPPFDGTAHDPGYIRGYPPGIRENGGQYTHAATWFGWAYVATRDGKRAEGLFAMLSPILNADTPEKSSRYRVEPYVLAGDIYGAAPWIGRGGWTWYTGAAAWTWRLGVEGILGLRKERGGLRIDPCIPPGWKGFEAWVRAGAQVVHVVVENPDGTGSGVASMTLDGARMDSKRVPLDPGAGGQREVRVVLGTASAALRA